MSSKVVVIVSIITIIIIATIPGKLASSRPDESHVLHVPIGYLGRCPPHNLTSEYFQITVLRSITPFFDGCAYIQNNPKELKRQSFSLWIGNFKNAGQQCREKNYTNMEHFHFNCLIKPPSSPSDYYLDDFNKKLTSVRLYPTINSYQKNTCKVQSTKSICAMYNVIKSNSTVFRMAISQNSSCSGLLDLLTLPKPINPNDKDEYMLLRLIKQQYPMTSYN
ncbi:uncharacterized protein LOC107884688 [Acyrthosiphon pisum]|uniref:Uncharacterized protein n=1 Tax=Acyrthosiphon pisum TaxID=7029 RepID=A0A8R2D6F5_ACYPI|nr:uncharacterized protein LOC107884688 [Acyrthosiphon pisum]|eukprot:XP_016662863.1 PREDICTED: uncharacterized protein LOC107884688 [Acyrthosiphon pisum]